jgi:hypothetical protein
MVHKSIISVFEGFIIEKNAKAKLPDITLRRCLSEAWFSDTLAWLLDPKADHGLGVGFANEFLKKVASNRSSSKFGYARRRYHLKWGKKGPGKGHRVSNWLIHRQSESSTFQRR